MAANELVTAHYDKLRSESLNEEEMKAQLAVPCLYYNMCFVLYAVQKSWWLKGSLTNTTYQKMKGI